MMLRRLFGKRSAEPIPELTYAVRTYEGDEPVDLSEGVELEPDECEYTTSAGQLLHGRGFRLVTRAAHQELTWAEAEDVMLDELGILVVRVAGVKYHLSDAQAAGLTRSAPRTETRARRWQRSECRQHLG